MAKTMRQRKKFGMKKNEAFLPHPSECLSVGRTFLHGRDVLRSRKNRSKWKKLITIGARRQLLFRLARPSLSSLTKIL